VDGYRRKRQEVRKQDSEGVPYEVTNAIRTAKSNAKKALEAAEAREDEMNAAKAEAEQAAAEKAQADKESDAAARDASAKSQQANDQAKAKAKAAAAAVESRKTGITPFRHINKLQMLCRQQLMLLTTRKQLWRSEFGN